MKRRNTRTVTRGLIPLLALLAGVYASNAAAARVSAFTPQGEVARVQQAVARFDADVVPFGDPAAADPLHISCDSKDAATGQGRWTSAREWVYDFADELPAGVRCEAAADTDFEATDGSTLDGTLRFAFNTGGPQIDDARPWMWQDIEEEQAFVLKLTGPATPESMTEHVWCKLESPGERVPVRIVGAPQRDEILEAAGASEDAAEQPERYWVVQCARRLTPATDMALVFDAGVAAPNGLRNGEQRRLEYSVRKPFSASTSCQRENAHADCIPLLPLVVDFTASIASDDARKITLRAGNTEFKAELDDDDDVVDRLQFDGPLPPQATLTLELPDGLSDESGRALVNADSFPMQIKTGREPPLAKFAGGAFGIVERFAEGPDGPALLPLTLRHVKLAQNKGQQVSLRDLGFDSADSDATLIEWFTRVQRWDSTWLGREEAGKDLGGDALPDPVNDRTEYSVETRTVSLLHGTAGAEPLQLPPPPEDGRPLEVIGVPLAPGFHVLEAASQTLGQSLLDAGYGSSRRMYVRTSALVTNLAVHFKLGREDALAWVTSLDDGQPVPDAMVQVSTCDGEPVASASTNAAGLARFADLTPEPKSCWGDDGYVGSFQSAYFVSARAQSRGVDDMAFTWSSWQRGFESWRFNVPTSNEAAPDELAHTIFDRTLLRAGETVSMKHLLRTQTKAGFAGPEQRPETLVITHVGSNEEFTQPVQWRDTASGGLSAENTFDIPSAAKLGRYNVALRYDNDRPTLPTGDFRVEEFRLPVLQGSITPQDSPPLVASSALPLQLQVNYVGGGAAGGLPVQVSASTRRTTPSWDGWDDFSFAPPTADREADTGTQVVADKLAVELDDNGSGQVTVSPLPAAPYPQRLSLEATYPDPNGELQTLASSQTLWPAAVVAGIRAEGWVSTGSDAMLQALALDLDGKPAAGIPLEIHAVRHKTTSTRKRLVGGFYTYDSHTETTDLGAVCSGNSDADGRLHCEARLDEPGEIELVAHASDDAGRVAVAATSVWVTRQGELWFGGRDDDRMDVLAENREYAPGDTARLQVRMPFRQATALVAVEREGVLYEEVVQLSGDDPTVQLKIDPAWGPNVYVSVLAVRGRIHDTPWTSFFRWGYRAPAQWWQAFRSDNGDYVAPTALVDLSKPAFRFGMAELRVGDAAHRLDVQVKTDEDTYRIRETAAVTIRATRPDGSPAAGAEVALAAVDQALLELMPNDSWDLLSSMMARRPWGVQTATAQMEIVGRRHYGRKAVAAGGGGGAGKSTTRELLDTLLLWQPDITLDENGEATVQVPLNDALTTFQIVAVADLGMDLFGTGKIAINTTQELQIISGLPPLVREGDEFQAMLTLRNGTDQAMQVQITPQAGLQGLAPQTVDIAANAAQQVQWTVSVPVSPAGAQQEALQWTLDARQVDGDARDSVTISQRVVPAVPLTVRQATLVQLDGPFALDVAAPDYALPASGAKRGGVKLDLQPRLATGLPAVADWFARYPYTCLEQVTSKAMGMDDPAQWEAIRTKLPTYLDEDGLAYYFPPSAGQARGGSDTLTAWLLAATDAAGPDWKLPQEVQKRMIQGLTGFVSGRLERRFWSPRADLDVRKLAAVEALSRYGAATPQMLDNISVSPNQWPTSAVIDWVNILQRVDGISGRDERLSQAMHILRARLSVQGTRLIFSTERADNWWWLMQGGDVNAARLLLTVMDDADWQDDIGRLVSGFLARQKDGAWNTTTANLWGKLALQAFSRTHERGAVAGFTSARLGAQGQPVDWADVDTESNSASAASAKPGAPDSVFLPWPDSNRGTLSVTHQGSGKPWLTLQSLAAVPLQAPFAAGYRLRKTVTPVSQADDTLPKGQYSRGDILRVTLQVRSDADMTWVAVTDPIPAGATILGSGLGRDSAIATEGEEREGWAWPAYEERSFESFRSYYRYLPRGDIKLQYTLRLNNAGTFALPPTRVEAIYAPEMFGESPNAPVQVVEPRIRS
ncbi:MAG: MG2 domain-containing protein [Ottowia sp.]|nr:MG2 domain-containing protein [Ottowia sp.]